MTKGNIKCEVQIAGGNIVPIDPDSLPMNTTIEELVEICCKFNVEVKITLQEKDK